MLLNSLICVSQLIFFVILFSFIELNISHLLHVNLNRKINNYQIENCFVLIIVFKPYKMFPMVKIGFYLFSFLACSVS